ncbi:hypothetical protein [Gloeothece verrucosa]|uniref:Uncharacterized protein n=1 Tax=Gloeothece verrucosa (strain PCC 7822) TaxID=497965 RepID=E0U8D0_GLOV7|nr:hypothetical protein [Gloeothece verrucosa]ADN12566.1 hypothetical protein Cyan7822_0526 [Gloeothece verrucosa PCC 7822]
MNSNFNTIDPNQSNVSDLAVIIKVISDEDRLPEDEHKKAAKAFLLSDSIASGIARDFAFVQKIPQYIKEIIENKSWECLYVAKGVTTPYYCRYTKGTDSDNFRAFITAKRPNGLETTINVVDNILNSDYEVQRLFRTLVYESRQGERTDLTEETSHLEDGKLKTAQQERIRAANRAAEAIPIIGELLDRGLIAIDLAAKLGRDIKDPDHLTADEREYVEMRDLIGLRINQYINTNIIPEDEYKEPAYSRELNSFVKDLLGIKDRSKSVRMDNPKKAADKLLQFYQGEKLKTLINFLQQGLEPSSKELKALPEAKETEETEKKELIDPIKNNISNGSLSNKQIEPEQVTNESKIDEVISAQKQESSNSRETNEQETQTSTTIIDAVTTLSQEENTERRQENVNPNKSSEDIEEMRLTPSELAKRLRLKQGSLSNAVTKYKDDFPEWTKKRDPDGIGWQKSDEKRGRSPLYIPFKSKNISINA